MSNTRTAQPKVFQFERLQKAAEKRREGMPVQPVVPPFVLNLGGKNEPIKITAPDTLERKLIIADFIAQWRSGQWDASRAMPLLQALCGNEFGRVWMLIKDEPDEALMLELINAMFEHFASVIEPLEEAADLPGGSGGSSN